MQRPVTIVTGFLGSGKSTLLNRMLRAPQMAGAAVIINEFGTVPIDQVLVRSSIENLAVLDSGCICCTLRGDLVDTILDLEAGVARGDLPPFERVVIETTGLADAAPILATLTTDTALVGRYALWSVIATLDATHAAGQLPRHEEARRQVALASRLVLTKTDIAAPGTAAEAVAAARAINPGAPIDTVIGGAYAGDALFAAGARPDAARLREWLAADAHAGHDHGPDVHDHDHQDDHHGHEAGLHGSTIRSHVLTLDEPIDPERLRRFLVAVSSLRGRDLLRMKGVVNLAGCANPVVVQGVGQALYEPMLLDGWPDADRRTRIVFITEGVPAGAFDFAIGYLEGPAD